MTKYLSKNFLDRCHCKQPFASLGIISTNKRSQYFLQFLNYKSKGIAHSVRQAFAQLSMTG
jgi:hypothetical protein